MKFSDYDLGQVPRGARFQVTLSGNAANVLLLDSSNFSAFKAGRQYRYHGGLATRSPVPFTIPRSGRWHIVIHMQGLRGSARHSLTRMPDPLPEIRLSRTPDLSTIVRDVAEPDPEHPLPESASEYDVFISHATEDKDGVVRDLAYALSEREVRVWYDEFEMRIGDSLRRKIDLGLARSRFGLVVLSHSFFAKNWPQYELDGIVAMEVAGRQRILPLWHNITKDEVLSHSPSLADRVAISTSTYTVEEMATEIADVVLAQV